MESKCSVIISFQMSEYYYANSAYLTALNLALHNNFTLCISLSTSKTYMFYIGKKYIIVAFRKNLSLVCNFTDSILIANNFWFPICLAVKAMNLKVNL